LEQACNPGNDDLGRALLHSPGAYPIFSTAVRQFGSDNVMARVEWHPWTWRNGVKVAGQFRGIAFLFQGPMTGAVLAPNAKLTFGRTSTPHRGSFFAKNIEVQADAQIVFIPYSGWLIEQVTLDKTEVCVNEPVKVSVKTNSAIAAQSVVYTTINGLPGTQQLLQFQGAPGIRLINVVVGAPASKVRSSQFATVTVKDCGSSVKFPRLAFAANPYHPNTADMRLTNAADLGIQTASYQWSFGDGTIAAGSTGYTSHDYSAALAPDKEVSQFEVTATITPSGATPIVAKAVIPVVNTYALNRNRGLLLPPVANQRNLSKSGSDWTGALSIKNSEPEQLSFSKREVELRPCNHESAPKYLSPETINLVVAASASLSVDFSIPQSQLSTDYCGLAVRYIGQSASGTKTVASAFFDANAPTFKPVTDATLGAALLKIVQQKLLPNTDEFSGEDVYRLAREGKLTIDTANATTYGPKDPARLDPGEQCHPGETPRTSSDGQPELVCTMVDNGNYQDMFEVSDAYLENAVRGDTLLSHFCGDVGAMLSALSPSQYYTHTGIMIGHYEYLRHVPAHCLTGTPPAVIEWSPRIKHSTHTVAVVRCWSDPEYPAKVPEHDIGLCLLTRPLHYRSD
jgi:hypothetical protein